MRHTVLSGLTAAIVALSAGVEIGAQGQNFPSAGACFFQDIQFGGGYFCKPVGTTVQRAPGDVDKQISSLRVFGNVELVVWDDFNLRGATMSFRSDQADLRNAGWNDRISSYRIVSRSFGGGYGGGSWGGNDQTWGAGGSWGVPQVPSVGACFFEDAHFNGQYFCLRAGAEQNHVMVEADNKVSSIRLIGNTELLVYADPNYRGASLSITSSVNNLAEMNFNDRLSSIRSRVRPSNEGWNPGGAFGGGGGGSWGGGVSGGSGQSNASGGNIIGRMEWRGRVDDRVQIAIRGRDVEQQTVAGATLPNGGVSFTSALPNSQVTVSVRKMSGRGEVRVLQQPARANGFAAVIEISDSGRGSDDYRIEVVWR